MQPTERFTERVADYVRYRPSYPAEVLDLLDQRCGLKGRDIVDVGSGTGILTKLLLDRGARVSAVEPNEAMRKAAEEALTGHPGFVSIDGTAEATGLDAGVVDLYTASQAFHWFKPVEARQECLRVLRPSGLAALIWNSRKQDASGFLSEYEALLESMPSYQDAKHTNLPREVIRDFLAPGPVEQYAFPNVQGMDWEGTLGRAASSSYFPRPGREDWDWSVEKLRRIFDDHAENGRVEFIYECEVFLAQPSD